MVLSPFVLTVDSACCAAVHRISVPDRVLGHRGASPSLKRSARAIAEALFATSTGAPPKERIDFVVDELDDFVRQAGPRARFVTRLAFIAVALATPFASGAFRPLHKLSIERRLRALERLEASRLGVPFFAVKGILCILYYEHPDAARELRFDPAARVVPLRIASSTKGEDTRWVSRR